MANFVDNSNMTAIMTGIADKFRSFSEAYRYRGSVAFASLPGTLTEDMSGYVYNVTNNFTTDARFVDGAGHKYNAGTNVAIANLSTYEAVTPSGSENPSTEGWYELENGKYVLSDDTTVESGKTYYTHTENVKFDVIGGFEDFTDIYNMISESFNTTTAYEAGDVVIHEGALYRFKAAHTAGAWNASQVDGVTVAQLIDDAEPESLTTAQVNALLALLN